MSQYDWAAIKTKYETGKYSMAELADEYGFNASYAARKAKENGWEKGKSKEKVEKLSIKKALEEEVKTEADLRKENIRIVSKIKMAMFNELFNGKSDFNRLKQLKIASEILENCKTLEWDLYKIVDTPEESKNEGLKALAEALNRSRE